ncbi:putative elongation factor 2 [Trypanosoma cruzi]|uniref:Putative elongation factor 2 n=1 Tax=Trypanosoma cruzi TaxID=5693 RepID=A0A2V2WQD0_TRYCR|nr:putative elongation factor 2 [Trypanosoma cruzi]
MGDVQVYPEKGTVAIGSGLQAWAFSVTRFAKMYAAKFGVDEAKMCERLWGDNFFDAKNKKWIKSETNAAGERVRRAFCQFCLDPIYQIFDAVMTEKQEKVDKMLKSLNISLTADEREQVPKKLLKSIMMKFLPAAETLLQMIVAHLPSPKKAQSYRAEMLYSGESGPDDKYYVGIKNCDPEAPLMLYISKMVPTADRGRFFAFGRIFAGKVRSGQKVRIMGNNYVFGKKQDLYEDKPVQRTVLMMGRYQEAVEDMPCGNVVGLVGVDKYIVKSATITDDGESPHPLRDMKYSVSPVVRVAVEAKKPLRPAEACRGSEAPLEV